MNPDPARFVEVERRRLRQSRIVYGVVWGLVVSKVCVVIWALAL